MKDWVFNEKVVKEQIEIWEKLYEVDFNTIADVILNVFSNTSGQETSSKKYKSVEKKKNNSRDMMSEQTYSEYGDKLEDDFDFDLILKGSGIGE
jgi:Ni,Fe-hydrogenase I large subunit